MGSLTFYYGSMNAGKSAQLLQAAHGHEERGMRVLLLKSIKDTRDGLGIIKSRIGFCHTCINFTEEENLINILKENIRKVGKYAAVLVDEAQFLTGLQVRQLAEIADLEGISVSAYGIRTDAFGNLFEGSQHLLALADQLKELDMSRCFCGDKATMNVRCDQQANVVTSGCQIEVGGNDRYTPVCRKHWLQAQRSKRLPSNALLKAVG
ncbi:MAG: thymidine kinase [Hafnia sp.]